MSWKERRRDGRGRASDAPSRFGLAADGWRVVGVEFERRTGSSTRATNSAKDITVSPATLPIAPCWRRPREGAKDWLRSGLGQQCRHRADGQPARAQHAGSRAGDARST